MKTLLLFTNLIIITLFFSCTESASDKEIASIMNSDSSYTQLSFVHKRIGKEIDLQDNYGRRNGYWVIFKFMIKPTHSDSSIALHGFQRIVLSDYDDSSLVTDGGYVHGLKEGFWFNYTPSGALETQIYYRHDIPIIIDCNVDSNLNKSHYFMGKKPIHTVEEASAVYRNVMGK